MEASPKSPRFDPAMAPGGHRLLACQPDAVLCRMAARGNDAAYEALYRRHHRTVYAFVFHLIGGRGRAADAEDITQDAFARAYASIHGKREGSFRHWILTIARNRAIDQIRGTAPRVVPLHDEIVEHDPAAAVGCASAEAEDRADFAWVVDAVGELPERQREALVLRELGGMSHAEIAQKLDTTVQATKQLIKRARAGVGDAARSQGVRPRNLKRELTLAAPLVPFAATAGLGAAGAGAGFGSSALAGKAAAAVLCVAALGGTTAAVEHSLAPVGSGAKFGPAAASSAAQQVAEAPQAPPAPGAAGERQAAESESGKRDRRRAARRSAARDQRGDGAAEAPSTAPADSGSAAAGDATGGKVGAVSPGFGPAAGAAPGEESGAVNGGAAAPE